MTAPRVSILIPNYNNGRASSRTGSRDFLADLFRSLHATLERDPTPLEIIVADDGSTDDSLETCRQWARRIWRDGQPFCRLIELPHSGIVSRVMNQLLREARGRYICRFDGDVIVHTVNWVSQICNIFDETPRSVGVLGAKQLSINGRIHSMGDFILHPRGYHHVAQGAARDAVKSTIEVDHVMGCFYCHRREVWEDIGDYDETILRGQTIEFGLRARLRGWRAFCLPSIEFTHCHSERGWRENYADTEKGLTESLDRFREKWGFDRLAPDLGEVARRHAGTPLLWNTRVFDDALRDECCRGELNAQSESAEVTAMVLAAIAGPLTSAARVLVIGEPRSLIETLLTARGMCCAPGDAGNVDAVLLYQIMERHPNPVGLLNDVRRRMKANGRLIIVTQERPSPLDLPADSGGLHRYRAHELNQQIHATRLFQTVQPAERIAGTKLLALTARPARFGESSGHFARVQPASSRAAVP